LNVAPHAGAWIETYRSCVFACRRRVAPHAGAWIETHILVTNEAYVRSRPTRARGLKQAAYSAAYKQAAVAPHAGAWIETSVAHLQNPRAIGRAPRGRVD